MAGSSASEVTACPPGTFSAYNSSTSAAGCLITPAGYYSLSAATTALSCGVGYFSDIGQSSCSICSLGHYCGSNTTTSASLVTGGGSWGNAADTSGVCFNGTYCSTGMTRAPDLLRDACPEGYYCLAGTTAPQGCPPGTYNPSVGVGALSGCLLTPSGLYSVGASTTPTGLCQPGYYCPAGSTGPNEVPCPARYYRPEYGGSSLSDCSLCVAGGYCPSASVFPVVCTQGFYCPTGKAQSAHCKS